MAIRTAAFTGAGLIGAPIACRAYTYASATKATPCAAERWKRIGGGSQ